MSAAEEARARANTNRLGKSMAREADKDILALRKAADELDALAAILAEAPHGFECNVVGPYGHPTLDCICWKSKLPADALAARDADKWDEGADSEHNDPLAGNPYRIEREAEQ